MYADVVVDNKSEYTDLFFTYKVPDDTEPGDKVVVEFAKRKKPIDGYVFRTNTVPSIDENKIKSVIEVDKRRSLSPEMADTATWMINRYGIKAIDAIKMFTVGGKRIKGEKLLEISETEDEFIDLTDEQAAALSKIESAIFAGEQKSFLLKGVTNSGKTEVYMRAIDRVIKSGRTAILLVPEIALSAQTEKRLKRRFGDEMVAVMHSKLSMADRLEEWLRIRDGRARIVVGARTAVFAPLENIGLIVIDEEHESTYKSDHNPKFETVDVAFKRAMYYNSVLIMGSATPSIISFRRSEEGLYELLEMKERVGESRMPQTEIVDMREEARKGNLGLFSERLYTEVDACLKRGEQAILFLNRRGYSTNIICPECGYRMVCDDCSIAMTYHKSDNAASCHYCGRMQPVPDKCPECGSDVLKYSGSGTEKVEEKISELFPNRTVERFDLDTAKNQKEIDRIIKNFQNGKTDILVGTQILAKGLDFRKVGLVGIIMADTTLNIPDYRSGERAFQLITQVAGRAGRGLEKGKVIIQTYMPDDDSIKTAAANDYETFYESEIVHRKIMNYPPFSDLIYVSFIDKKGKENDPELVMRYAKSFRKRLLKLKDAPDGATVLNPRYETLRAGSNRNRAGFIIKAPKGSRNGYMKAYMNFRDLMISAGAECYIEIDVNPYGII